MKPEKSKIIFKKKIIKFIFFFLTCFFCSYLFFCSNASSVFLKQPIAKLTTYIVYGIFLVLGIGVEKTDILLSGQNFSLIIADECTPFYSIFLILSATIAFPCPILKKTLAFLIFPFLILAINTVRIAILFLTGNYFRGYLEIIHNQIAPNVSIVLVSILWFYWIVKAAHENRDLT